VYRQGQYNSPEDFGRVAVDMAANEAASGLPGGANRVFYLAIPPAVFVDSCRAIKHGAMTTTGWNRVIVEKPFGHDSA
jgi:glucose-6-phosphate 1-dehydrogenase